VNLENEIYQEIRSIFGFPHFSTLPAWGVESLVIDKSFGIVGTIPTEIGHCTALGKFQSCVEWWDC
jgi:hypothetical protein